MSISSACLNGPEVRRTEDTGKLSTFVLIPVSAPEAAVTDSTAAEIVIIAILIRIVVD